MKNVIAILLSLGLLFMISCGDEGEKSQVNETVLSPTMNLAPGAAQNPTTFLTPPYTLFRTDAVAETVWQTEGSLDLYVSHKVLEDGDVAFKIMVLDSENRIHANYPVRTVIDPNVRTHSRSSGSFGQIRGGNLYFTGDETGKLTLTAYLNVGASGSISFDISGDSYIYEFISDIEMP